VANVKKLQWIGTRHGERVVLWQHVSLMFVVLVALMTLVRRCTNWVWNAIEPTHPIESWRSTILSVSIAAVTLLAVFVLFAWKRPVACSTDCDDSAPPLAQ